MTWNDRAWYLSYGMKWEASLKTVNSTQPLDNLTYVYVKFEEIRMKKVYVKFEVQVNVYI